MRTVLVTGASSGMGRATAEKLLAEGYVVYVAARRHDKLRDLEAAGATALTMDITRDEEIVAVVERITAERGGIDVLINNAGSGCTGRWRTSASPTRGTSSRSTCSAWPA